MNKLEILKKENKKDELKLAFLILIIIFAVSALLQFLGIVNFEESLFNVTTYAIVAIGAFYGLFYGFKIGLYNFAGKSLFLIGLGMTLSFVAYISWSYYSYIMGIETPYPSIADWFWILGFISMILGVFILMKIYYPRIKTKMIIEAIILLCLSTAIFIKYLGWPDLSETVYTTDFFDVAYTMTDIILFTIAITILRIAGGKIYKGLIFFIIAFLLFAAGDIFFAIRTEAGTFFEGDISDIVLMFGWIFNTAAIYYTAKSFISSKA